MKTRGIAQIACIVLLAVGSAAFAGGDGEELPGGSAEASPEFAAYSGSDGRTASDILEDTRTTLIATDILADITMTLIHRSGAERVRELSLISKEDDGLGMSVIHFQSPPDVAGTGFLMLESGTGPTDMWLFLPELNRVRRIVSSNRDDSFMGSDITYADMEEKRLSDYSFARFEDDAVDGEECYVVQLTPVSDSVVRDTGYSRLVYWISKEKMIPLQAVFFDETGTYFKRMLALAVDQIDATWMPTRLKLTDVDTEHRTHMELRNVQIGTNPDDSYFTQQYLQRGK